MFSALQVHADSPKRGTEKWDIYKSWNSQFNVPNLNWNKQHPMKFQSVTEWIYSSETALDMSLCVQLGIHTGVWKWSWLFIMIRDFYLLCTHVSNVNHSTWPCHSPFISSIILIISSGRYNLWSYISSSFLQYPITFSHKTLSTEQHCSQSQSTLYSQSHRPSGRPTFL